MTRPDQTVPVVPDPQPTPDDLRPYGDCGIPGPHLPHELYDTDSPWTCLGRLETVGPAPAKRRPEPQDVAHATAHRLAHARARLCEGLTARAIPCTPDTVTDDVLAEIDRLIGLANDQSAELEHRQEHGQVLEYTPDGLDVDQEIRSRSLQLAWLKGGSYPLADEVAAYIRDGIHPEPSEQE